MTYHEIETEREEILAKIIQLVLEQDTLIRKLNGKLAESEKKKEAAIKTDNKPIQEKPKKKPGRKPKLKIPEQEADPEPKYQQLTIDDIESGLIKKDPKNYGHFMGTNLGALVNQEPTSRSSTGVKGVYKIPHTKLYEARVTVDHKELILYRGTSFALACRAREMGIEEYYKPIIEKAKEAGKIRKDKENG